MSLQNTLQRTSQTSHFSIAKIAAFFRQEIASREGTIHDIFDDGSRLYCRAVLPRVAEVRANDNVQAGVALYAKESLVRVRPYVLRQVCTNGAIMATSQRSQRSMRTAQRWAAQPLRWASKAATLSAAPWHCGMA